MDEDDFFEFEEQEISEAVQRYEVMLRKGKIIFFDVFQIEHIVDCFLDEGKIYPALQAVEFGIKQHPGALSLQVKKALILLNTGEITEALSMANDLMLFENTNHELHLLRGTAYLILGNESEAEDAFNEALKCSFDDKDLTLYNIAFSYEQSGNFLKAIKFLEEAIKIDPENEAVLYELGFSFEKIGNDLLSLEYYNKYLDIDPFSESAWFNVGIIFTKQANFEKAAEAYQFALALNDDFPSAIFNLAYSSVQLKQYENAVQLYFDYLTFDSENDEVYCMIAECYFKMKQFEDALFTYEEALKLNKHNEKAWYGSSMLMKIHGNYQIAYTMLKKAIKLDCENGQFRFHLAKLCVRLGYDNEAIKNFTRACKIEPDNSSYWLAFANMYYRSKRIGKAIQTLTRSQGHLTNSALVNYRLTAFLLETNDEAKAALCFEKALNIDFSNHRYLFKCYPKAKNSDSINQLISKYKRISI